MPRDETEGVVNLQSWTESTLPKDVPEFVDKLRHYGNADLLVGTSERVTYAEVLTGSTGIAKALVAAGVTKGTRIGLMFGNGREFLETWLGVMRIGAIAVPLSTMLKSYDLRNTLRHSDIAVLLTTSAFRGADYIAILEEAVPDLVANSGGAIWSASMPALRSVWVWGDTNRCWTTDSRVPVEGGVNCPDDLISALESEVEGDDPATIIYTSGSSGTPKGVIHSQRTVAQRPALISALLQISPADVLFSQNPWFWIGGLSHILYAMNAGARFLWTTAFDPDAVLELLEREHATMVMGLPYHLKQLSDEPSFETRDFSKVRYGWPEALSRSREDWNTALRPRSGFGMTETFGTHSLYWELDRDLPEHLKGSVGTPLPGVELLVVDPETGQIADDGSEGELWVRGAGLMLGIIKRDRCETFEPDGWYRTGDLVILREGHLIPRGRMGAMIKTAGANVDPREVETVLCSLDEVAEAFVVGIDSDVHGQEVATAIVLTAGRKVDLVNVINRVRSKVSSYKAPRRILIVAAEQVPRFANGKLNEVRLREMIVASGHHVRRSARSSPTGKRTA
jgi:acyl-CoA synthetase (AMP-forming)/AMP-acid ligase II